MSLSSRSEKADGLVIERHTPGRPHRGNGWNEEVGSTPERAARDCGVLMTGRNVNRPRLIVFDLDFTLWDCGGTWCDCLSPPFQLQHGRVVDRTGRHVRLYDDVGAILDHCDQQSIRVAAASRTEQPAWARELLNLLQITDRFGFAEIYPSSKLKHFAALRACSGFEYEEMLFFDDEMRNIREVSSLGVTSVFVSDGLSSDLFHDGLRRFVRGM